MSEATVALYRGTISKQAEIAEELFADEDGRAALVRCHSFLNEIEMLANAFQHRSEKYCIAEAHREYQFALSALVTGHYRHAFVSLRLTFEMLLHAIYFSGHEVKLKQWLAGARDLTWRTLMDENKGIFAADFVRAFDPDHVDERKQYKALAEASYRECSEFVHGNPERSLKLVGELEYKKEILLEWEGAMQNLRLSALFCYLYRYGPTLSDPQKTILAGPMTDAFGHIASVQNTFEGF